MSVARFGRHPAPVDEAAAHRLAADEDVLGDRHVRRERELLVDRDDAELLGRMRRSRSATVSPANSIVPASGCCAPAQDLEQRRLAGAVLAEQRVDLAGRNLEVDLVQGLHAGEALADPGHAEQGFGH